MPKVVTLYPAVTVWCEELDQLFQTTPGLTDGQYIVSLILPPNEGDSEKVYSFEAYANAEPTGLITYVTVGYQTVYEYHEVVGIHPDRELLSYKGGEVTFCIDFDNHVVVKIPSTAIRSLPYFGATYQSFVSSTGEIFFSGDAEGIYKYDGFKFNKLPVNGKVENDVNAHGWFELLNGTIISTNVIHGIASGLLEFNPATTSFSNTTLGSLPGTCKVVFESSDEKFIGIDFATAALYGNYNFTDIQLAVGDKLIFEELDNGKVILWAVGQKAFILSDNAPVEIMNNAILSYFKDSQDNLYVSNAQGIFKVELGNGGSDLVLGSDNLTAVAFYESTREGALFVTVADKVGFIGEVGITWIDNLPAGNWKFFTEDAEAVYVASDGLNGEYVISGEAGTYTLELNEEIPANYCGTPLGPVTYFASGSGTKVWANKQIMIDSANLYTIANGKGPVGMLIDKVAAPTKALIVKER